MPIYSYECLACKHDYDQIQQNPAPTPPCPNCGEVEKAQRKITASNFSIKGYNAKNGYSK